MKSAFKKSSTVGFVVFLIAYFVRILGIGWGLPDESHHWSRHPDEPVIWLYSQNIKPAEFKFTPGFYNYGTLYLTLLRVSTDVVNGYGGGPQKQDGSDQWKAIGHYHLAGRMLSALAGAGMAWVAVLMLWKRTNKVGAVFAGLAVAFAPGLVIHSKFQTVDVMATFFLVLGLYYALRLVPSSTPHEDTQKEQPPPKPRSSLLSKIPPDIRLALASGLFFGLSTGTKYTGILGLLALVVICLVAKKGRELVAGVLTSLVTFVVTTPGTVLDSEKFWKDFGYEMAHTSQGHGLVFAGTSSGFLYHLGNLALALGTVLVGLGLVGMARAAWKKHLWAIGLIVFACAYFLLIGRAEVKFMRYVFPLVPVLAVFAGWIVGQAHGHPDGRMRIVGVLGILGLGGLFGGGAGFALKSSYLMQSAPDPRQDLARIVEPGGSQRPATIGLVSDPWFYTPDLYPEAGAPRWVPFTTRQQWMDEAAHDNPSLNGAQIFRVVPDNPDERIDWDVRLLEKKPDVVVFSSFETEGLDRMAQAKAVPSEFQVQVDRYKAFLAQLQRDYSLVPGESENPYMAVHDLMYIRPTIWVWKRKTDSQKP